MLDEVRKLFLDYSLAIFRPSAGNSNAGTFDCCAQPGSTTLSGDMEIDQMNCVAENNNDVEYSALIQFVLPTSGAGQVSVSHFLTSVLLVGTLAGLTL